MDITCKKKQCAGFIKPALLKTQKKFSFIPGLLLALLPKCPFCIMAYSGTFVLCGEAGTLTERHSEFSSSTILFSILFCGIIFMSLLFNYRDNRTKFALLLASLGSACILCSVAEGGGLVLYYTGVMIVFFGVWLNGSLLYFLGKIKWYFKRNNRDQIIKFQQS